LQLSISDSQLWSFSLVTSTNLLLPMSNWTTAPGVFFSTAPGQFQFTTPPLANDAQRFFTIPLQ
jgi:hypothetical protein